MSHRQRVALALSIAVFALAVPGGAASAGSRVVWHSSFDFRGRADRAVASATSPDGSTVVVTGTSRPSGGGRSNYGTVAFDTSDGAVKWAHAAGSATRADAPTAVSVSPDGAMTAVSGLSHRRDGKRTWRTVAYATADGIRLWESIFRLPDVKMGSPQGVFVGNENVLVVGNVQRPASGARPIPAVVIAYTDRTDQNTGRSRFNRTSIAKRRLGQSYIRRGTTPSTMRSTSACRSTKRPPRTRWECSRCLQVTAIGFGAPRSCPPPGRKAPTRTRWISQRMVRPSTSGDRSIPRCGSYWPSRLRMDRCCGQATSRAGRAGWTRFL